MPPSCVPATVICAPARGCCVAPSMTRPVMVPVDCADPAVADASRRPATNAARPVRRTRDGAMTLLLGGGIPGRTPCPARGCLVATRTETAVTTRDRAWGPAGPADTASSGALWNCLNPGAPGIGACVFGRYR